MLFCLLCTFSAVAVDVPEKSLTDTMLGNPDPRLRVLGIKSLDHSRHPVIQQKLAESLKDPDDAVRIEAARALGVSQPVDAAIHKKLLNSALHDENSHVRRAAIRTLSHIKPMDSAVQQQLLDALSDSRAGVRIAALKILYAMEFLHHTIQQKLKELFLLDSDVEVRLEAKKF